MNNQQKQQPTLLSFYSSAELAGRKGVTNVSMLAGRCTSTTTTSCAACFRVQKV